MSQESQETGYAQLAQGVRGGLRGQGGGECPVGMGTLLENPGSTLLYFVPGEERVRATFSDFHK